MATEKNVQEKIKDLVREKYGQIAAQNQPKQGYGCGCSSDASDYTVFSDSYDHLKGYAPEADLGLGCGLPTEFAGIRPGDTVVDLGSGAGNDAFVARAIAGESGRVIGLDMTPEMIERARANAGRLGYRNVEFISGDIEAMPIVDATADVVVSNCVLNLVPDKRRAFAEIHRILKPGGRFCISDIVLKGQLPEELRRSAEMYAGCVAGAVREDEYLGIIAADGFSNIEIKNSKAISLPDETLRRFLLPEAIVKFRAGDVGIFSITVVGTRSK